jgi:hypothetical protein
MWEGLTVLPRSTDSLRDFPGPSVGDDRDEEAPDKEDLDEGLVVIPRSERLWQEVRVYYVPLGRG